MGVAKSHRRRGIGTGLLLHNLFEAKRAGGHRVIIPWVDEQNETFYAQAVGAIRYCRFWKVEKTLPPPPPRRGGGRCPADA